MCGEGGGGGRMERSAQWKMRRGVAMELCLKFLYHGGVD